MKIRNTLIFLCLLTLFPFKIILSQDLKAQNLLQNQPPPRFLENKGQIADLNGRLLPDVKYIFDNKGGLKLILKENSFSYEVYSIEKTPKISEATGRPIDEHLPEKFKEPDPVKIILNRVDVTLKGSNPHPEIIAGGKSEDFVNYYKEYTPESGITDIHYFDKVTYRNIYKNIDFVFMAQKGGSIKYNIVVHPGGRLSDLRMCYNGMMGLAVAAGKIEIKTVLGNVQESIPSSYEEESGKAVLLNYAAKGNVISLKGMYDRNETLVVDPLIRQWATYYGSSQDVGYSVATDKSGNVYLSGYTYSSSGIASNGAYQTSYKGGTDAFLVKFNSSGSRLWATYYGGSGDDISYSIATDRSGNVYLTGYTASSTSGMASSGAYQTSFGGSTDAFLVKFNSSGSRLWGTYYGGSNYDDGYSVATDGSGNVFLAGLTASSSGIASSGAYQTSNQGDTDAFLVKFNSSGSRQWGTYYGGSSHDIGYSIATDSSGNVFLGGYTAGASSIASSGAFQTSFGGSASDAFLVKFNGSGTRQWGTYYGGRGDEFGYSVAADGSGNVYLAGYTTSTSGIASSGAYQTSNFAPDAFLVKFNSSGSRQWGTYYGVDDYGYSIATDSSGNIFLTGYTFSKSGMASSGAYQISNAGYNNNDAFLAKFNNSGSMQWGTYYGGSSDDYGQSVATYGTGKVYLAGYTYSTSGIASSGAYQTSFGGISSGAFLVKFSDPDAGVLSIDSLSSTYCRAKNAGIYVKIKNYSPDTKLDSVFIGWSVNNVLQTPAKYTNSLAVGDTSPIINLGSYIFRTGINSLKVWTYKPNGETDANTNNDTLKMTVTIYPLPTASFMASKSCLGDAVKFTNNSTIASGSSISSYLWNFGGGGTATSTNLSLTFRTAGSYTVKLTATSEMGCMDSVSKTITIYPLPTVSFSASNSCIGNAVGFTNSSTISSGDSISSYSWNFGDGDTSASKNPSHIYSSSATYPVSLSVTTRYGCTDKISKPVIIYSNPIASFILIDSLPCNNSNTFHFKDQSSSADTLASWAWGFGDFDSSAVQSPSHSYKTNGNYVVSLTVTSKYGCTASASKTETVSTKPAVSFDINDSFQCLSWNNFLFNDKTISADSIVSRTWAFGDKDTAVSQNASHSYSASGAYSVILNIKTLSGCSNSASKSVEVFPSPTASFYNQDTECFAHNSFDFIDKSISTNEPIIKWAWNFGDGDTSSLQNPTHSFGEAGNFNIKLIATTKEGCIDSAVKAIVVNPTPEPKIIGANTVCINTKAVYKTALDSGDKYNWAVYGANILSRTDSNNITLSWADSGKGFVYVTESSPIGCVGSENLNVNVNAGTKPSILGPDSLCGTGMASYHAVSISGNSYQWKITNGIILSGQNSPMIKAQWNSSGFIRLYQTNTTGCADSNLLALQILPLPLARNYFSNGCQGSDIQFEDSSSRAAKYLWDFGDGSSSTNSNPDHVYSNPGVEQVKEVVTGSDGCTDSLINNISIYPLPQNSFVAYQDSGRTFQFKAKNISYTAYNWNFGDGNTDSLFECAHYFAKDGDYEIKMKITDDNGCSSETDSLLTVYFTCSSGSLQVSPDPFESQLSIKYTLCQNAQVQLIIYDELGRLVAKIVDANQQPDTYNYSYDATSRPSSGLYLVKFIINGKVTTKEILRIR